jgi:hypothetical protein
MKREFNKNWEEISDGRPNKWRRPAALAVGVFGLAVWAVVISLLWARL